MNQRGEVKEILKGNKARILMKKHAACGECGACQHGKENMNLTISAVNDIGAQVGDVVEVNMDTQNVLGAAFIMYVIPLFFMLLGIGVSSYLLNKLGFGGQIEFYAVLAGFSLMAISFLIIRQFEDRFRNNRKYIPEITRVIDSDK